MRSNGYQTSVQANRVSVKYDADSFSGLPHREHVW